MTHPTSALSLLVATTLGALLLFAGSADAKFKGINPWCTTADHRGLCTKMVGSAKTQNEAITNAVQATLDIINRVEPQFKALGQALSNLPEISKNEVISTCDESYAKAVDNLKEALEYLKIGNDTYTVIDRVQVTESNFFDCTDAIKQMGGDTDFLGKTTQILFKYSSNALAVAVQM